METREIGSVTLLSDRRVTLPVSEIVSHYTSENPVTVSVSFGDSAEQERRIEDGESCDLFITSDKALLEKMRIKGMVDVHSISELASNETAHYFMAVVASENMTPARAFLAFLKDGEARSILRRNHFKLPER